MPGARGQEGAGQMALYPRLTRGAARLCLDALRAYLPTIDSEDRRQMAIDTIGNLDNELNREGQRRQRQSSAAASAEKEIQSSDTITG